MTRVTIEITIKTVENYWYQRQNPHGIDPHDCLYTFGRNDMKESVSQGCHGRKKLTAYIERLFSFTV